MNEKNSRFTKKVTLTSGFSILEVLVAFGLIAIVAAGIASLTTSGMKQQKGLQAKDQQREVTAEIRNLLNSKAACANSFGGPPNNPTGTGFTVNTIRDASAAPGAVKYTVNTNDKTGLLRFEEFRVSNFVVDPANANQGTAELQVRLSKVGDTGTVRDVRPDIIMLKVMRNIPGFIIECFSIGGKNEALWQISTNLSDIYYNGGNVGIGTTNPQNRFSIDSTGGGSDFISVIKPVASVNADIISPFNGSSNFNTGSFQYGTQPSTTSWVITKRQTGDPAWVNLVTVRNNGNVGIGIVSPLSTLDVSAASPTAANSFKALNISRNFFGNNVAGSSSAFIGGTDLLFPVVGLFIAQKDGVNFINNSSYILNAVGGSGGTSQFVVTGAGNVGIGTAAPAMKLDIRQGNIITSLNNSHNAVVNQTFANGGQYSAYIGLRGRGTEASPSYPITGDTLGGTVFRDAIDGLGIINFGGAEVYGVAVENFSATSKGTRLDFNTTPVNANMPIRRMTISDNGNIGIGTATPSAKLEVTGEIKLGNTSSACNVSNEGQMRYNSTIKNMQFCNGTAWTAM